MLWFNFVYVFVNGAEELRNLFFGSSVKITAWPRNDIRQKRAFRRIDDRFRSESSLFWEEFSAACNVKTAKGFCTKNHSWVFQFQISDHRTPPFSNSWVVPHRPFEGVSKCYTAPHYGFACGLFRRNKGWNRWRSLRRITYVFPCVFLWAAIKDEDKTDHT